MGCSSSTPAVPPRQPPSLLKHIPDQFSSLDQLQTALRSTGLESSNLIIGIDFTKSNEWTGKRTFGGRSLHDTSISTNPYSSVINIIGRTLEGFDDDALIPVYGFGSADTGADKLFSFNPGEAPCHGFEHVMQRYMSLAPHVRLAGPTTFAPIIRKAIEIVSQSGGQYHILVIIADGQVTRPSSTADGQLSSLEQDTANAIVEASHFPLSIVLVGVGDGPWDLMDHFDDAIPHRRFDNWQSVVVSDSLAKRGGSLEYCPPAAEAQFALDALMEVPDQYRFINQLGLMGRSQQPRHAPIHIVPPADGGGMAQGPPGHFPPHQHHQHHQQQHPGHFPPQQHPGHFPPQQHQQHPGQFPPQQHPGHFPPQQQHPGHFPPQHHHHPGGMGGGGHMEREEEASHPPIAASIVQQGAGSGQGASIVPPPVPGGASAVL